ncbi:MAG: hypothetical protein IJM77_03235 [Spirochaetia bacterium]|nr:hypothetical protein [Spirochaetia bacterium]MBQ3713757.1 hypothetical protein [Spirochaetia bacterium]MBQ6673619.1 hypothetical protein [Spirochaetia bacterium]
MKKSTAFIICILLVLCGGFLAADDAAKEGDAVMCPTGLFPDRGYYGASDSFAVGSIVKVTNKANSKSVDVYIVDKSDSFMVLSYDAALKIGIKRKNSSEVQVSVIRAASVAKPEKQQDKIVPVAKKSYQLLPDGVEASKTQEPAQTPEKAPAAASPEKSAPAPEPAQAQKSSPAPAVRPAATPLSKDDEEAVFEDIKDKVVAFIAADDVDQAAARYVSADTVGKSLPKPAGTFYVQLGFFSSLDNAEQIAYTVQTSYPVLIVSKEMSTYVGYRVLAGPVPLEAKEDVLGDFRDAGFPDAFASF